MSASEGKIYQNIGLVSSGYLISYSVDYSVSDSSAKAYWEAYNAATSKWYNASLGVWQVTQVQNLLGSSTSRTRAILNFNNDSSSGDVTVSVTNGSDVANASKSIYIYHVQLEFNTSVHERIISGTVKETFAEDIFIFPSTLMNFTEGAMTFNLYPSTSNSTAVSSADRDVIGSGNLFFGTPSSGTGFRLVDGSGNALNVSGSYQINDEVDFIVRWKASDEMSIKSTKLSVDSSTSMGSAYSSGYIGIGQEGNLGNSLLNGSLQGLKIYGP